MHLSLYPTVSLTHFYQYTLNNAVKAKKLMLRCLQVRKQLEIQVFLKYNSSASQSSQRRGKTGSNPLKDSKYEYNNDADDEDVDNDSSNRDDMEIDHKQVIRRVLLIETMALDDQTYINTITIEMIICYVVLTYISIDLNNDYNAMKYARNVISLSTQISTFISKCQSKLAINDDKLSSAAQVSVKSMNTVSGQSSVSVSDMNAMKSLLATNKQVNEVINPIISRVLCILLFKYPNKRLESIQHCQTAFQLTLQSKYMNPYTMRVCSVIFAQVHQFQQAYQAMESSVTSVTCNDVKTDLKLIKSRQDSDLFIADSLTWKCLSIMSYLYRNSVENAIIFMKKSVLLSNRVDIEGYLLLGQMLLENKQFKEARSFFQEALHVLPTDPLLWVHLGVSVQYLNHLNGNYDGKQRNSKRETSQASFHEDKLNYQEKCEYLHSLRQLIASNDSNEIIYVATRLLRENYDISRVQDATSPQDRLNHSISIWHPSHYMLITPVQDADSSFDDKLADKKSKQRLQTRQDVSYLLALYHVQEATPTHLSEAKSIINSLISDVDTWTACPVVLAAYLRGWISEVDEHNLKAAERYYSLCIPDYKSIYSDSNDDNNDSLDDLDLIHRNINISMNTPLLTYLKLYQVIQDTYDMLLREYKQLDDMFNALDSSFSSVNNSLFKHSSKLVNALANSLDFHRPSQSIANIVKKVDNAALKSKKSKNLSTTSQNYTTEINLAVKHQNELKVNQEHEEYLKSRYYDEYLELKERLALHSRLLEQVQHLLATKYNYMVNNDEGDNNRLDISSRDAGYPEKSLRSKNKRSSSFIDLKQKDKDTGGVSRSYEGFSYASVHVNKHIFTPKKYFMVSEDWLESFQESFMRCDDWTVFKQLSHDAINNHKPGYVNSASIPVPGPIPRQDNSANSNPLASGANIDLTSTNSVVDKTSRRNGRLSSGNRPNR